MGYKGNSAQGEIPESGAIFMSNIKTKEECLKRKLFGLPSGMSDFVLHVKEGMTLFLFEFERRLLYGVYRATCDGDINIDPKAFRSSGKHFPAQVRFTTVWECDPLAEIEFKDVIRDNYHSGKKFYFGLNKKQVSKLMKLFRLKVISKSHQERNTKRYDEKPSDRNTRSHDLRTEIRHRLRFDRSEFRGDEVKEVNDDMYINKHIIEDKQKDKQEDFLTRYHTESEKFGDYGTYDILGKHIEDAYMPVYSKPHEIGVESSGFLMDGENKDIADYNRLHDEYKVRERYYGSLDEHLLTNRVLSPFNQNVYSNCDPIKINVPDIPLSPPYFDNGSSFIPIANELPFYPSPEKIHTSKSIPYYSHEEESTRYLDDHGSQSSIFPKFITRNLSSVDDLDPRLHEVDPPDNDKRFFEACESKHKFGSADKRASVFSRLSSTLKHKERDCETGEKHELDSSVDKVMKMLEKVASNPRKKAGKSISAVKQDDDVKIEDFKFPDVKLEVDADMAYEEDEAEGDSVFQETRLTDFKRRKKLKRINDASKQSPECLVGAAVTATSADAGPVETDPLTGSSRKRRKLVRPAFVEKNFIPDAHEENTGAGNDRVLTKLEETSVKGDASVKSTDEIITVATSVKNTHDDSNLTKAEVESSDKIDAFMNSTDESITVATSVDDSNSTKAEVESSEKIDAFMNSTNEVITVATSVKNTPDDINSTKEGIESSEKVDAFINSENDIITVLENTPDDSTSTKAGTESVEKVDSTNDVIMVLENTPDDTNSTKAGTVSLEKDVAFNNSTNDIIMVLENAPDENDSAKAGTEINSTNDVIMVLENTADDNNLTKAGTESLEKVDGFMNNTRNDVIMVHENTGDDSNLTEAGIESSEKADALIKDIDLNMVPACDESSSSSSTKASVESLQVSTAECERKGNEGDGNAENCVVSGVFGERIPIGSLKDDQKMCGWIEW